MPETKARARPVITHTLHDVDGTPVLEIREERPRSMRSDYYSVLPLPSDFGRAFVLRKMGPEPAVYNCCVVDTAGGEDGAETMCDCIGFEARGYCKHSSCLAALVADGKL